MGAMYSRVGELRSGEAMSRSGLLISPLHYSHFKLKQSELHNYNSGCFGFKYMNSREHSA
jgi:hypothetical protein